MKRLLIANFSVQWTARLFLLEPSNKLSLRAVLGVGERHSEWTSPDDVWVISVHADSNLVTGFTSGTTRLTDVDIRERCGLRIDGALALLVKPCLSALEDSKTTSILWTPSLSLSVARRVRVTPGVQANVKSKNMNPHLSCQILDG